MQRGEVDTLFENRKRTKEGDIVKITLKTTDNVIRMNYGLDT